jgi:acyl carrier protein
VQETESIEKRIKEIVVKILHCSEADLRPETTWKDLNADSLDLVQVLVALEDTFDFEISDEDAENFSCFGDIVGYVKRATES